VIEFVIPVQTISESNARGHHMAKARRVKEHRTAARHIAANAIADMWPTEMKRPNNVRRAIVTLMRVGKKNLDSDNLLAALKAVRDGVADALGIDDGSDRVQWHYGQAISKTCGVRVTIEPVRLDETNAND
jgi:hypothetical protein